MVICIDPAPRRFRRARYFDVDYVCEVVGDGQMTPDLIRRIGERSLKAEDLVVE